jgi:FkbM family methyltransferase
VGSKKNFMSTEALARILSSETLVMADVGASYFLSDAWHDLLPLPSTHFVLFDPVAKNLEYAKQLPPNRVTTIPVALSGREGPSEFFLANTDSGSSLLPPHPWPGRPPLNDEYFFPLTVKDIETRTLASVLDEHRIESLHAIKLDTQGSELDIVKGLDGYRLEKLLLVEMEVTMDSYPAMLGAAKLPEVINYFEHKGFRYINTLIARKSLEASGCVGPAFASTLPAQHECDALFVRDIVNAPTESSYEFISNLRRELALLCAYYLHGEALDTARLAAEMRAEVREVLPALENSVAEFAEYQSARMKVGPASKWHPDKK